jgi:peptidyl-prolyl cis-trans isomerase SurA
MRRLAQLALACSLACLACPLHAGDVLDRVAATVNGQPILQSEVEEEAAFDCLFAGSKCNRNDPEPMQAALERLVDRKLLTQQMRGARFERSRPEEVQRKLDELRRQLLPAANDDTQWNYLLQRFGISEDQVRARIAAELDALRFLDAHFRPGTVVTSGQIANYYNEQFVPKLPAHSRPPELRAVTGQIREILVQQAINGDLNEWLTTLRQQSTIEVH